MAGNFFYRQSKVSAGDLYTNARLRNNAFVKITGGGASLPISANGFTETYNPNGTGRAAPILKEVKISLEGDAGSLRRVQASFTCFDRASFEKIEEGFLTPGADIKVSYGYVGPANPSQGATHDFRVYDYSFKITKENYFDCSLKAVGKGASFDEVDINGVQSFPEGLEFITNYDGKNETSPVQNMFDYWVYAVQKATGNDNAAKFSVTNGQSGPLSTVGGYYGCLHAPENFQPYPSWLMSMLPDNTKVSLNFLTLESIVSTINKFCLKNNPNKYQVKFHPEYSKITTWLPSAQLWSPAPFEMLFPQSKGSSENSYHADKTGASSDGEWISCDTFTNVPTLGTSTGTPKNILIAQELLKAIQTAFADAGKNEDETTEDAQKADGNIPLTRFYKKLFATIRENSAGIIDLYLEHEDGLDDGTIWIINRKSPSVTNVTPLKLEPTGGKNGVREIGLSGKVPKDIQAKAFGGAPDTKGSSEAVSVITEKPEKKKKGLNLSQKSRQTRGKIHKSGYSKDSTSTARGVLKELANETSLADKAAQGELLDPTPYPLAVDITTDGIEGFRFGDTLSSNYLPSRYTKNSGVRVVFTLTKYEHAIKGNDWSTKLTCLSRIVS